MELALKGVPARRSRTSAPSSERLLMTPRPLHFDSSSRPMQKVGRNHAIITFKIGRSNHSAAPAYHPVLLASNALLLYVLLIEEVRIPSSQHVLDAEQATGRGVQLVRAERLPQVV